MMGTPIECELGDHGSQFRANAVAADQVLSAIGGEGKGFRGSADQAIPQNPAAAPSGRVLLLGHGLGLPCDKRMQRIGWNYRAPAYPNRLKAIAGYVSIEGGPPQAGGPAGFLNAVGDLGRIIFNGLHWSTSFAVGRGRKGQIETTRTSYVMA